MLRTSLCPQQQPPAGPQRSPGEVPGAAALLLLLLLTSCTGACRGVPVPSQTFQAEQDFQLWNEIVEACSSYLSTDPQVPSALKELCFIVMGFLQKSQGLDEKDNTKRFLFHYSKSHDSGNSDITSSVLHPLLQLVPQLNERRLKRDKMDVQTETLPSPENYMTLPQIHNKEEYQGPGAIQSRGYFIFRKTLWRRGHAMEGDQQVSAKKNF